MSRADNQAVSDGCTPRIAIFPLRYSVHAKPAGAVRNASYEASTLPLELGFPALKRGQYRIKGLQEGFVYVLDETRGDEFAWKVDEKTGQFVELDKRSAVLESALKFHKVGQTVPHIWARSGSRVHIVVTGTLLTKSKLRALRMNTNGIRDKIALSSTWRLGPQRLQSRAPSLRNI
ncbi:MAG: toxin VasX [Pseudomonas sp.]